MTTTNGAPTPGTSTISPKVYGGIAGTGIGSMLVTLYLYWTGQTPPGEVVAALTGLVNIVLGFGLAWLAPERRIIVPNQPPSQETKT